MTAAALPKPIRWYHPARLDRLVVVSVQPVYGTADQYLIAVARGAKPESLVAGTHYGPFASADIPKRWDEVLELLRAEGYGPSTLKPALAVLTDPQSSRKQRAAAATRLGWWRDQEAVPALLALMPKAIDELCAVLDALGAIGDPQAIPAVREMVNRKLLSRRRSGVEALRLLADRDGLIQAWDAALERLPDTLRPLVQQYFPTQHPEHPQNRPLPHPLLDQPEQVAVSNLPEAAVVDVFVAAVQKLPPKEVGLALDNLYECDTQVFNAVVRQILETRSFATESLWRYVKSLFKRAQLRHDWTMLGWLTLQIERQGRQSSGIQAKVKSGYDGTIRDMSIFSRQTQYFLRRSTWRYLRTLAHYYPTHYPLAAAFCLTPYAAQDAMPPKGLSGHFAKCYLLNRILFQNSQRLNYDDRRLTFRYVNLQAINVPSQPKIREEAFPTLWDQQPRAIWLVLRDASLPMIQQFALRLADREEGRFWRDLPFRDLLTLLDNSYPTTAERARHYLQVRLIANQGTEGDVPWDILDALVANPKEPLLSIIVQWLENTVAQWVHNLERVEHYLQTPHPAVRQTVLRLVGTHLNAALGQKLAEQVVTLLRAELTKLSPNQPVQSSVGTLSETPANLTVHPQAARVQLARDSLMPYLTARVTVPECLRLLEHPEPAFQALAAELFVRQPDAQGWLTLERTLVLANHAVQGVRHALQFYLKQRDTELHTQTDLLFALVESDWPDTRQLAKTSIENLPDWSQAPLSRFMGLLDSNRPEIQQLGCDLVAQHLERLDAGELLRRLVQHPQPHLRQFAFELATRCLPHTAAGLHSLRAFLRTVLLSMRPQRALKDQVFAFLRQRGLQDREQAQEAVALLVEILHAVELRDRDQALSILTHWQCVHPELYIPGLKLWPTLGETSGTAKV